MQVKVNDVIAIAIIIPVTSVLALWAARRLGQWFLGSMQHSFAQVVVEVMAPDMAHQAGKITHALDELNAVNAAEHAKVQGRLEIVDGRLTDVETRLEAVEAKLGIRSPDARTRATDPPSD